MQSQIFIDWLYFWVKYIQIEISFLVLNHLKSGNLINKTKRNEGHAMKKLIVSISVAFLILTTGCEMRTMSKQQSANERTMSIVVTPVHEKDYKISDLQANNHEQSNY